MRWPVLLLAAMLAAAGCKGKSTPDDAGDDPAPDGTEDVEHEPDAAVDPVVEPVVDVPEEPVDVDDEETSAECGNREVEPGEDCDPPLEETACFTTCGTAGTGECTLDCQAPGPEDCTPPAETCNLMDDDCDGVVDEGAIAAWTDTVTLSTGGAASAPSVRLAWTGSAFVAAWVVDGTPDAVHVVAVDQLGEVVTTPAALALTPGEVSGRPGLAWTGSNLMLAWSTTSSEMHTAVVDLPASILAHTTTTHSTLGPSPDLAWAVSRAALVWTEQSGSFMEMNVRTLDTDGAPAGFGHVITSGATTSQPAVDADASAIAVAWVDARTGAPELHRAAYGLDGSFLAHEGPLTSTGGVSSPAISATHRIAAWTDGRDGTDRIYTIAMDGSWNPVGTDASVADASSLALDAVADRIGLAAGADLLTLGTDGVAAGTAVALGLDAAAAVAWGDLALGAAGAAGADLVLALAGCAEHESCDAWIPLLSPLETRTGHDLMSGQMGHDAAIEGSFTARPVTYLSIQMYQDAPYHGPTEAGIYTLTGTAYEACGLCVLVYEDCGTSTCGTTYLARSGVLAITHIGTSGDRLAGVLTNARLDEVTINSTTRESHWVEDGDQICLGSYAFDETID